jgi:catechol 2,3-dioxygenase-like lactoylglutathione lyase family enzyme
MPNEKEAIARVAVKNLKAAVKFYEGTLGLRKEAPEAKS